MQIYTLGRVRYRAARQRDIAVLEAWQPTGRSGTHARRFARQIDGTSTFLIAWDTPGQPVASCEIRWNGSAAPEVAAVLQDCPELNGLQVWPESKQGHGVGTALIREVERRVRERGIAQLGLGVDDHNDRAAMLYRRLGFAETGVQYIDRYVYVADDGTRDDVADPCRFLVKTLTEP